MTKLNLQAVTPVGTFTRATGTPYTHIVVWKSPRAAAALTRDDKYRRGGVDARWVKDNGFGVTWHNSERTAENATAAGYKWDGQATLVGVFAVSDASTASPQATLADAKVILRMALDDSEVLNPDGTSRPLSDAVLNKIRWALKD